MSEPIIEVTAGKAFVTTTKRERVDLDRLIAQRDWIVKRIALENTRLEDVDKLIAALKDAGVQENPKPGAVKEAPALVIA